MLGGIIFVGLFNLVVYFGYRKLQAHYYYGILCLFYSIWNFASIDAFEPIRSSILNSHYTLLLITISANRTIVYFLLYIIQSLHLNKPVYEKVLRNGANFLAVACFFMPFSESYTLIIHKIAVVFNMCIVLFLFREMMNKVVKLYKDLRIIVIISYLFVCILVLWKLLGIPFVDQTLLIAMILMVSQSLVIAKQYNNALVKEERMNELLEQKVAVRTAELLAKEQESKHVILSISHDLRTPISVVSGYLELLERDPELSKTNKQYIANSTIRLTQMERLTRDLFTLSQLNDRNYTLQIEKVSIANEIERIATIYKSQAKQKGVILQLQTVDVACNADQLRLMQVLDNLLMNSLSFAKSKIRIATIVEQDVVAITVTDDGLGIHPEELPFVFDRFYKKRQRGSGIGLSNVKELVQRMGGEVTVESEPLVRTCFRFTLPRSNDSSEP